MNPFFFAQPLHNPEDICHISQLKFTYTKLFFTTELKSIIWYNNEFDKVCEMHDLQLLGPGDPGLK